MNNNILKKLSLGLLMIALSFLIFYFEGEVEVIEKDIIIEENSDIEEVLPSEITVDISGEVEKPGVYTLSSNSRVFEVINMAGGLKDSANISYLNLAQILTDEEKIVVQTQNNGQCFIKGLIPVKDISDGENLIFVCILGEVNTPCVVKAKPDYRVIDVVDAAGGFTANTDTSRVNLAEKLDDGMMIYIPAKGSESTQSQLVNINTANVLELKQLTGIGDVIANEIVLYREKNGFFKKTEDLMKVSGIGQAKYNLIKDKITIY